MDGADKPSGAQKLAAAVLAVGIGLIQLLGIQGTSRQPFSGMALTGFLVARVEPGSPADRAGLADGDVITAVDGVSTSRPQRCQQIMETAGVGRTLRLDLDRHGTSLRTQLTYAPLPRGEALINLSRSAVSVVFLLLGIIVYLRRVDRLGLLFALLCSAFAVLLATPPPIRNAYIYTAHRALLSLAVAVLPAFFVHFFLLFPEAKRTPSRRVLAGIYVPAVALAVASVGLLVAGAVTHLAFGRTAVLVINAADSVYFAACFIAGAVLFIVAYYKNRSSENRRRLRVALWGTVAGVLPIAFVVVALNLHPTLRIPGERFIVFSIVLIPASFAYAIARHRVLDVQLLIRRSIVYSTLTAVFVAVFFLLITLFGTAVQSVTGRSGLLVSVLSIFAIAVMATPLRNRLQVTVDQLLFKKRYDSFRALKELGEALSTAMDLDALVMILVSRISSSLGIQKLAVYTRERTDDAYTLELKGGGPPGTLPAKLELTAEATAVLESVGAPISLAELAKMGNGGTGAPVSDSGLASAVPFLAWGKLRGLLLLDVDASRMPSHERELLTALAARAGTAIDNALLYREALERHRLEKELSVARLIQEDLLPKNDPVFPALDVSAAMIPSHEVGGDYYDYVDLGDRRLGIGLGDVTGKGIPASLMMATVQATLRADAERTSGPSELVALINKRVQALEHPGRLVTFFYCCLDATNGTLTYCNAGHHPPLLLHPSGAVERLTEGGLLMGMQPDPEYAEGRVAIKHGDVLVIYTDGIIEQTAGEEFYGEERLLEVMRAGRELSAAQLKKRIIDSVMEFSDNGTNDDDLTLVVLKAY
jgi:sigma-B regulation protein RsbU (phosphoserine phosphatase)